MFQFLKNHPFAVEAFFEHSIVLTFSVPKEELQSLIPECLELDILNEKWAFIAVALVRTSGLRPKGFPKLFGNDFFLIGYRIFVRYINNEGKKWRGLYILKSETDKRKMEFFGNIFTHYNYTTTDIQHIQNGNLVTIQSEHSDFCISFDKSIKEVSLPSHSPFLDWKEARRFAGPLPFTFTYDKNTKKVLIIEGVREHWQPAPLSVIKYDNSFLKSLNLQQIELANAFIVENIPYHWKKGKIEQWNG
jgi:uncharacterized protein YqjF (DUF2071 family)